MHDNAWHDNSKSSKDEVISQSNKSVKKTTRFKVWAAPFDEINSVATRWRRWANRTRPVTNGLKRKTRNNDETKYLKKNRKRTKEKEIQSRKNNEKKQDQGRRSVKLPARSSSLNRD